MALEKKNITFPFARGINEKPSERAQAPGEMRSAYNITITKTGEFNKRVGFDEEAFTEVGGGSAPSTLYDCAAHENELIVFDGEKAYSRYKPGGFKDRGTCVNTKLTQSICNVDASSVDGAPAYCQALGGDGELYEIFVWESRPMGIDDIRADTKTYANSDDTVNYRNKQSKLLYSIRHRDSGAFIKDAVPLVVNGKEYVDRDILLTKAGSADNGFYIDTGSSEVRVSGYGSTGTATYREWEDVASNGNRLIVSGDAVTGVAGDERCPIFFVDENDAGASADYAVVARLADSEPPEDASGNTTESQVTKGSSNMANVSTYLNVETGGNSLYFTTQPMLFSMEAGVVILTFAAQGEEDLYTGPATSPNIVGRWGLYQATFDLSAGTPVFAPTGNPSLITNTGLGRADLNFKYPIWDADLCYTTAGSKHGILYLLNSANTSLFTQLEFWAYNSVSKIIEYAAASTVPRSGGTGQQLILQNPASGVSAKYDSFGSKDSAKWPAAAVASRVVLKCVNDQSNGSQQNDSQNKIVFMLSSAASADNDIYVYDVTLTHDGTYSFGSYNISALLDTSTGSQTWTLPDDLLLLQNLAETGGVTPFEYDGSAAAPSTTRFTAKTETILTNGAITNVKNAGSDKIYVFAEVAYAASVFGVTWRDAATSGGLGETRYISSENRWIIRKNIANSSDTKVLGRNINILSDAFYLDEGSKAYFVGHSVHDGDPSTARTCMFNEDGEVVGVYAAGQAALCHPYEIAQMTAAAPIGYTNTPMFALRSRLNSYVGELQGATRLGRSPTGTSYPMPQFGISVIENAERTYQYTTSFNPRIASITFFPWRTFPNVQQAGTLFVGSGLLWAYNGARFIENGFLQKPLIVKVDEQTSNYDSSSDEDAGCTPGKYVVAAAYFYKDNNGVTHYSAMDYYGNGANVERITITADVKKLRVRIAGTSITNKRSAASPVRGASSVIDMNPGSAGIALFVSADLQELKGEDTELKSIPLTLYTMEPMVKNARYHEIDIDSPMQRVQFDQTSTFAPPLLDNAPIQPSCPTDITVHRNHLCVSTTDGYVYPSQSFEAALGSENSAMAPLFGALNVISISEETNGTGASHIESDGQFLMAFNRTNVYAMGGNGPDQLNSASVGTFNPPDIVYLDQGIEVGAMCARIPAGILYQSMHGYYLLSGKSLSFLGGPVEDQTAQSLGVQVIDETNEVVICTATRAIVSDTYGFEFIVYNYEVNQWYNWRVPATSGVRAVGVSGFINSVNQRQFFFVTTDGKVWMQKNTDNGVSYSRQYSDYSLQDATYYAIESKVKTGEIQIPQFFSEFRLYRIAIPIEYKSDSVLTIKLYYNGGASAVETFSITQSGLSEIILKPKRQKCRSIAVEIEDDASASLGGQGTVLNGLGLLVAPRVVKTPYNTALTQVPAGS